LPLGWVLALLIYGLVRRRRRPLIVAACILYLASMPLVGNGLFHRLEIGYRPLPLDSVEKVDAIVPLGGILGPTAPYGFLPNVGEAGERLEAGIALMARGKADWLVFTGGRAPWAERLEVEGAITARAAMARGIAPEKILVTREVGNTADEARAVAELMRARGWHRIILVTSGWHMRRAARLFRKAGVDFIPFPVDFQVDTRSPTTLLDLLPRADGLRLTEAALREWYGMAFYALFGR
jgi:uncharacterized SAM-binding protein YcdF (DUF218 family)